MSSSKRHFTAVIGKKEQGSYTSSSPSSAARKAVSKLCADDKNRKVEFYMRETTQSSEKKVYGMYVGYMEKLKKPIELKGRVIRYKPVAKLLKNKKMRGGRRKFTSIYWSPYLPEKEKLKHLLQEKLGELINHDSSEKLSITKYGISILANYPNFEIIKEVIKNTLRDLNIDVNEVEGEVINIHHFKFDITGKTEDQLIQSKRELENIFSKGNNGRQKQIYTYLGFNANHPNITYKNVNPREKFFIAQDEIQIAEDFPDFDKIKAKIIHELNRLGVNFEEVVDTS
jgi:hypothetical protein